MQELITFFFGMAIALSFVGYGIVWMTSGSASANRCARWVMRRTQRFLQNAVVGIGRMIGGFCQKHPFAAGAIAIILILALAFSS